MEPEKFLIPLEFASLLKVARDDRERCILLLLAGAGLRVGEMTQIRAEDVEFSKGYLHVPALNAKFKKSRTVVLLPQVAELMDMALFAAKRRQEHVKRSAVLREVLSAKECSMIQKILVEKPASIREIAAKTGIDPDRLLCREALS